MTVLKISSMPSKPIVPRKHEVFQILLTNKRGYSKALRCGYTVNHEFLVFLFNLAWMVLVPYWFRLAK